MTELSLGNNNAYVDWLKSRGLPLFNTGDIWWRLYRKVLVPASTKPEPIELNERDGREILEKSGALLIRHFSATFDRPTDFWFVRCDQYAFDSLPGKLKTKI